MMRFIIALLILLPGIAQAKYPPTPETVRCIKDSFDNRTCSDGTRIIKDSFDNFTIIPSQTEQSRQRKK